MAMSPRKRAWLSEINIACLVFAVALAAGYVRSHWRSDAFSWLTTHGVWQLQLHRGGVFITFAEFPRSRGINLKPWITEHSDVAYVWAESNVGGWSRQLVMGCGFVPGNGYSAVRVPMWMIFITLMLYPIWWYQHPQRRRREQFGICFGCGYDLRGSRERCPECGRPFYRATIVEPPPAPPRVLLNAAKRR